MPVPRPSRVLSMPNVRPSIYRCLLLCQSRRLTIGAGNAVPLHHQPDVLPGVYSACIRTPWCVGVRALIHVCTRWYFLDRATRRTQEQGGRERCPGLKMGTPSHKPVLPEVRRIVSCVSARTEAICFGLPFDFADFPWSVVLMPSGASLLALTLYHFKQVH